MRQITPDLRTCPDCKKKTKKVHDLTTRTGHFLDQLYDCWNCGWCGVETVLLTYSEVKDFERRETEPKQLRLL